MDKFRDLNGYQKGILVLIVVMVLIFAIIYLTALSRVGFDYKDAIFVPSAENGNTVYSGKINGIASCFIVSADKSVEFHYGDTVYGPYTIKEDPTAIPKITSQASSMTGIEVREGSKILFRGGMLISNGSYVLYNEDPDAGFGTPYVTSDGRLMDENGKPVDAMMPTISTMLQLINDPVLTHKGNGLAWFGATLICILNAISILFADALFRFHMSFRVENTENVWPSDFEIAGRYIGWTIATIGALAVFIFGLL